MEVAKVLETSIIAIGGYKKLNDISDDLLNYVFLNQKNECGAICWVGNPEIIGPAKVKLPPLHKVAIFREHNPSLVFTNDQELMFITWKKCWVLKGMKWVYHSQFKNTRKNATVVKMPNGIYVFGGQFFVISRSFEFLPNGSTEWQKGPDIIEEGVFEASGIAISSTELLLIGGEKAQPKPGLRKLVDNLGTEQFYERKSNLILKINIETNQCTKIGTLPNLAPYVQSAIFNDKVFITYCNQDFLSQTAILPLQRVKKSNVEIIAHHDEPVILKKGGNLNGKAKCRRMGIVRIDGISKLIMFGTKAPVEQWNEDLNKWEISEEFQFSSQSENFAVCYNPM